MKKVILLVVIEVLLVALCIMVGNSIYKTKIEKNTTPINYDVTTYRGSSKLGDFLTNSNGLTLYVYSSNPTSESSCDYSCLKMFHPFIATISYDKDFSSKNYILPEKITIVKRGDGLNQYAYEGKLLYTFVGDKKPGDVLGLSLFGKKARL